MKNDKTSVIVIEDDEVLLDAYEYYINSYEGFELIGMYSTVTSALKDYDNVQPDIIVSDISMPGLNGIEGVKKFKTLNESIKIILISVHDEVDYILDFIESRVDGYLTKPISKDSLLNALESVLVGGMPLTGDVSKQIVNMLRNQKEDDFIVENIFSEREAEILNLFTKGYTYKAIAETLFITHSTVNFHIQNIYCKLDVNNK